MHTHVRIYTSIIDTVLSAVCFLEGPTCWRMGWPHVAGRGGPHDARARKRRCFTLAAQCACLNEACLTIRAAPAMISVRSLACSALAEDCMRVYFFGALAPRLTRGCVWESKNHDTKKTTSKNRDTKKTTSKIHDAKKTTSKKHDTKKTTSQNYPSATLTRSLGHPASA